MWMNSIEAKADRLCGGGGEVFVQATGLLEQGLLSVDCRSKEGFETGSWVEPIERSLLADVSTLVACMLRNASEATILHVCLARMFEVRRVPPCLPEELFSDVPNFSSGE
ncbi:MAG: hypothetical protein CMO80_00805 [Verrucomicrobiales bacterium]|nr:hypothetical protein [Verrucomicrobiales bacterium]